MMKKKTCFNACEFGISSLYVITVKTFKLNKTKSLLLALYHNYISYCLLYYHSLTNVWIFYEIFVIFETHYICLFIYQINNAFIMTVDLHYQQKKKEFSCNVSTPPSRKHGSQTWKLSIVYFLYELIRTLWLSSINLMSKYEAV